MALVDNWIDWAKLRREWRSFAITVAGLVVEIYDGVVYSGAVNLPTLVPETWRPWFTPAVLILILLLRKYRDSTRML